MSFQTQAPWAPVFGGNRQRVVMASVGLVLICSMFAFALAVTEQNAAVKMPTVTPEMRQYSHIRYLTYFLGVAYECLVLFLVAATGLSAYLRDRAEKEAKHPVWQFMLYFSGLYLVICIAMSPLAYMSGFSLEHQFHLTHQSLPDWLIDLAKEAMLGFALSAPVVGSYFFLVRRFSKQWPFYFCVVCSLFIGVETFISPVVLEPVMNRFSAMQPGPLRDRIRQLAARAGCASAPIYVADKSKQTDKLNAYVSGIGASTHIVIWDTTIKRLPEDQVVSIVGHELGHYYLHHVYWDFILGVAANVLIVPVNLYLTHPFVQRLPRRWKIRGLDDFALTPVLALAISVGSFLLDPVVNAWSRHQEAEADAFSLAVTGDGPALARSFVSLSEQNLSEPDPPPLIEFWLFSHPSLKERIEFALGGGQQTPRQ